MKQLLRLKLEMNLKAGIKYDETAKVFVTYAPALRIYSQGDSELQAKNALQDAIKSFLFVAYKKKVLEKCLQDAGFSTESPKIGWGRCAEEEYISIEATILEKKQFRDVFDVPASLSLVAVNG